MPLAGDHANNPVEEVAYRSGLPRIDTVAVLGHSWGGVLAMEYALHYPERVSTLVVRPRQHDVFSAEKSNLMKVIDVQLDKHKLMQLPEAERTLYLSLGHAVNETNALAKMLYWVSNAPARNGAEERGRFTLELLFIGLLAGKLYECWKLLRKIYFGKVLSQKYDPKLDDEAREAFQQFRTYFKRENSCKRIRNLFAFHNSPEIMAATLPTLTDELHVYLQRDAASNDLFAFSEALLAEAIIASLKPLNANASLEHLVGELFHIGATFAQAADALMFLIVEDSSLELRITDPVEVQFERLPEFEVVSISWFSDTSDTIKPRPNSV